MEVKSHLEKAIDARMLKALYRQAGWWEERNEQDIITVLDNGTAYGAWHQEQLVGFVRGVSDGLFRAYVEDVIVHKDYRNKGVGTKLIETLMEELSHIHVVSLFCEPELIPFYAQIGFKLSSKQQVMHWKSNT